MDDTASKQKTFKDLGLIPEVLKVVEYLGYKKPTKIQENSIPVALQKKDIIGIAQTGSGKTASFLLPMIQHLLNVKEKNRAFYCIIIEPTRELAAQVVEVLDEIGKALPGLMSCLLVGGMDVMKQSVQLAKRPHVIVGTPGRIVYHIKNTKGVEESIQKVKFLVIDEADKLLEMDFANEIDYLIEKLPSQRTTMLFSATMSTKVEKLQRASLTHPVKIKEEEQKYQTVDTLRQEYCFIPFKYRDGYLLSILKETEGKSIIIFTMKCSGCTKLVMMLRQLGYAAIPLHGKMSQQKRLIALEKFKSGKRGILVATDVASRGLDIPNVDIVINYDCPLEPKDYIHRVGRTARAGKSGYAITLVTQYSIELYQRIETMIEKKLNEYKVNEKEAIAYSQKANDAMRIVSQQLKEEAQKKKEKLQKGQKKLNEEEDNDE
ncbi:ATP-dependent rRNA helicase RRP3, putative [Entamoeba dispar SAW760]|uniref:ATP-dependent rRNA helicase RRP3, putative n=1 Tax=Entamoeba dispar (strain ATCC PRA-260 / SAW760) TaxID=370354 RepID=B0EF08_ENTDS|nr:ATP-dependent rRNA helicase RRP3, putative [Entamoeba dispar SAW760]EDR26857.1 ATP-dependent rRNA helicase RRP3, putative [Entamoeba dispar SAW760]|eukprot:EDR26857.1 ATP-dependent rRNA helicase RRP3, putative [Entamoeba dispar SAW760]